MPELSVIILSYNTRELLRTCLDHLFTAVDGRDVEVIVVDNASTDGSQELVAGYSQPLRLIANDRNAGFAAGNNQGLEVASGDVMLLLNSDAFINREAIDHALHTFNRHPQAGIVGLRINNPDGSCQAGSGNFPSFWDDLAISAGLDQLRRPRKGVAGPHRVDWVHGACLFVHRSAYQQIAGLDTTFFMYSEEVEWCYRCWKHGWEVWYLPDVSVTHVGGGSSRERDVQRRVLLYASRLRFRQQVGGAISSFLLWLMILAVLGLRVVARFIAQTLTRRQIGRQTPASDWALLCSLSRINPLRATAH